MTTLLADFFKTIPSAPRYYIERPAGTRPFTLFPEGCRFRYAAESYKKRVEISPWGANPDVQTGIRLAQGKEWSFEAALRLPKEQVFRSSKTVVMQWYQKQQRNPPLSLELVGSQWRLVRLWGDATFGNPNRETIWTAPATRGAWVIVKARLTFAPNDEGRIYWEWNGVPWAFPGPCCYTSTEGINPKLGVYRPSAPAGEVMLMDFGRWVIA